MKYRRSTQAMQYLSAFAILGLSFLSLSCTKPAFENPVDPSNTKLSPLTSFSVAKMYSDTAIMVSWQDPNTYPSGAEVHYLIDYSTKSQSWTQLADVLFPTDSAILKALYTPDTAYTFRLHINAGGKLTDPVQIVHQFSFPAPSNLYVISFISTWVEIGWQTNSTFQTGFEILQGLDSINMQIVDTAPPVATSATILGAYDLYAAYYWRVRAITGINKSPLSSAISNAFSSYRMIYISSGTFQMGSNSGETDEKPVHPVNVSSFYIGETEVTQKQWKEVIDWKNANGGTSLSATPSYFNGNDNRPVERVSWNDIQMWLGYLRAMTGNSKWRLPSEAEWEYAARGARDNGPIYAGSDDVNTVARYFGNSSSRTWDVKLLAPNELGLHDMSGNVWEWCQDWYHTTYDGAPSDGSAWESPSVTYRVLRGGSWDDGGSYCRVAVRYVSYPDYRYNNFGFRLASTP